MLFPMRNLAIKGYFWQRRIVLNVRRVQNAFLFAAI